MYIAKKPCHFQGKVFRIGETIPAGIIEDRMVSALVKWGMITEVDGVAPKTEEKAKEVAGVKAENATQTAQIAPETTEKTEAEDSTTDDEKPVRGGKRGGRKKAEV